jgi:hypothetical protein
VGVMIWRLQTTPSFDVVRLAGVLDLEAAPYTIQGFSGVSRHPVSGFVSRHSSGYYFKNTES